MTLDNNLTPHEEIKSTSKGNYLNIKESMKIFFFFLLTDIKVHKAIIQLFYNFNYIIFKDIIYMTMMV